MAPPQMMDGFAALKKMHEREAQEIVKQCSRAGRSKTCSCERNEKS